jgi:hypothetical protein
MVSGAGLTDPMRNLLFDTAQTMFRKGQKKQKIKGDNFEGLIATKNKKAVIGGVSGTIFIAEIDMGERSTAVSYLMRPGDLHSGEGFWGPWDQSTPLDPSLN